uniref:MoeA C-terminal domain-containing protein n=1 Tax=Panagrolaimus superbus TaxID=310955 RepID=A0A914YQV2_9BILA
MIEDIFLPFLEILSQLGLPLAEQIRLDLRPEYRRAWLSTDEKLSADTDTNVPLAFCTSHNQLSSFILSTRGANLLLKLPSKTESQQFLKSGDIVSALVIGYL